MSDSTFLDPNKAVEAAGVHEGMRVADFGAAGGFFTRAAARAVGQGGVVWAVDSNRDLLARIKNVAAAEGLHNVEIVYGDIERASGSNLPSASFDFVIAANVLFTLVHPGGFVEEVWRVLRPGGHALIIDWVDSFGGLGPHPSHVVTKETAKKLFLAGGFSYAGDVPAGAYHWGFVVRKKAS